MKDDKKIYAVTGVLHSSIVITWSEAMARKAFEKVWKEKIICVKRIKYVP